MGGGLLQKLQARTQRRRELTDLESIVAHLSALLNTRRGGSRLDPRYGLPDYTDLIHAFPTGIAEMCEEIATTIERFEPRLTQVDVVPHDGPRDGLTLHFEVRARLASTSERVRMQTDLSPTGQVRIR